jgi:hypothetical protein
LSVFQVLDCRGEITDLVTLDTIHHGSILGSDDRLAQDQDDEDE